MTDGELRALNCIAGARIMGAMETSFHVDRAALAAHTGVLETDSGRVPFIDLREIEAAQSLPTVITQLVSRIPPARLGPDGLRLVILALPQRSDELTVTLAGDGIHLLTAAAEVPEEELLERFKKHLRRLGHARAHAAPSIDPSNERSRTSGSEAVLSQRPPWFDPQAFEERMRSLNQPWQDKDRWTSES